MLLNKVSIAESNTGNLAVHKHSFDYVAAGISDIETVLQKLVDFQVAIPSWALGTGGTRFGRFSGGGEPGRGGAVAVGNGEVHSGSGVQDCDAGGVLG